MAAEKQLMEDLFDVVLFGVRDEITDRTKVMREIARILQLDQATMARAASGQAGVVLRKSLPREVAEKYRHALQKAGAICNVRPAKGERDRLELLDPADYPTEPAEFRCPACGFKQAMTADAAWPRVCPQCGTAPEKYHLVSRKKEERSIIRQRLREAHLEEEAQLQALEKRLREAARRKQIEQEVRRELGFSRLLLWRVRRALGVVAVWAAFLAMVLVLYLAYQTWMVPHPEPAAGSVAGPAR